jgi:hypothetical protein
MGPALCCKLLQLRGLEQEIEEKSAGRVEDVSGPKTKTNLEAVPKRNSKLAVHLQQYTDVTTLYLKLYLRHSTCNTCGFSTGPEGFGPMHRK